MLRRNYDLDAGKIRESGDDPCSVMVCIDPDGEQKRTLIDQFKIDEHTLNSALDPDELSRLEFEPEHIAIIFKRPRNYSAKDQFLFKVSSLGAFLFKDKLLLVSADDVPLFDGMTFSRPPKPAYVM